MFVLSQQWRWHVSEKLNHHAIITLAVPIETADRLEQIRTRLGVSQSKLFGGIINDFIGANDNPQSIIY